MSEATTDREMLELAARAAGLRAQRSRLDDPMHQDFLMNGSSPRNQGQPAYPWNPLRNDGDALRLSSALGIDVTYCHGSGVVTATEPFSATGFDEPKGGVRRAIVRAAAELGKRMSPTPLTAQEAKP